MGNCICKPMCKGSVESDEGEDVRSEEGGNVTSEEEEEPRRPYPHYLIERWRGPPRQDIDDLVQLAVNEDGLATMLENDIAEDFTKEELDEYYSKRDALVDEFADDVIEAELLVLGLEAGSVYDVGNNYRPIGAQSDVILDTSTSSVFRYLQLLQRSSVMHSFIEATTYIPDFGSYVEEIPHPCYAFDSRCSLTVRFTPNADADNTNDPDIWVLIEVREIAIRSGVLSPRSESSSAELGYEYRGYYRSFSIGSHSSRSVQCIESGVHTVDQQGTLEENRVIRNVRVSVDIERAPSSYQGRLSSDNGTELQRNTTRAGISSNETSVHSYAELNKTLTSKQSFYSCVRAYSSHSRSGSGQTSSWGSHDTNLSIFESLPVFESNSAIRGSSDSSKSHNVRPGISLFDRSKVSRRNTDTSTSTSVSLVCLSTSSFSPVCLPDNNSDSPRDLQEPTSTSNRAMATYVSEANTQEEYLGADSYADTQPQASRTPSEENADEMAPHATKSKPDNNASTICCARLWCARDGQVHIDPPYEQSSVIVADDLSGVHAEEVKSRRSKISRFFRRLFRISHKKDKRQKQRS